VSSYVGECYLMKRILTVIILICTLFLASCGGKSTEEYDLYCYEINKIIKDIDFDKGNIADGKIVLYKDDSEVFNQEYENFDSDFSIEYIRKEGSKIFFVLNASADDDEGIVYVNDSTNGLMDGLVSLERINGNSYKYKTFK